MDAKHKSKMKKFTLKGVLDGIRSSVSAPPKFENEVEETLRTDHFQVCKTVRHGFPYQPTAVAFDPVQHLLAIGTKTGSLRILGRPGVDIHCSQDGDIAITQILFLVNEGALVTVCNDDSLHLWNFRQKRPEIVHTLKFQRERITYCHLPFQSKWLYIGTERGNVHIANIESFVLSGYVINWNKAIELSRKTHPGTVVHLSDSPVDPNKLLIGFETGAIVLWDLKTKSAECRYTAPEALRSISWHHEGKQFMCSHTDGSLTTYNLKCATKPVSLMMPHAKIGKEGKPDPCKPITKVEWKSARNGDLLVIFSGGMSYDRAGRTPSITVMNGKSTTVLEMEHNVVDFVVLCETPWHNDFQEPYAIVVLLQNDLVVVDLTSPGYPCFENPYPMDLHESPVTACQYYADCPPDLIPAFYSVGSKHKRTGFSEKNWPVKGGEWGTTTCSYPEILITGHADGSMKFWDASSVTLQVLYKLKTAKIFEKPKFKQTEGQDDDPFAIYLIHLCQESRMLCVAGATHVILFKYSKQEITVDVVGLDISIIYEVYDDLDSPDYDYPKPSLAVVSQQQHSGSMGSYSSNTSDSVKVSNKIETGTSLKVRPGSKKYSAGFYPDLVCLLNWLDNEHPGNITNISMNSSYGLLAFGNESGLAIIDYLQKTCLLNLGTPDLYGSMDPYQRAPRSPRGKKFPQPNTDGSGTEDGCRSPINDQSSPPSSPNPNLSRKKIQSHPDVGLTAIQESSTQDSAHKETKFFLKDIDCAEKASMAEDLDNNNKEMLANMQDKNMLQEIKNIADEPVPTRPPRHRRISMPDSKQHLHFSLLNPHKSNSENALKTVQKQPAGKTLSDPSRVRQAFEIVHNQDNIQINRERSCSDPEVETTSSVEVPKEHHRQRKLSMKGFKFSRKKSKVKPPNLNDLSLANAETDPQPDHSGDEGSDTGGVREDPDSHGDTYDVDPNVHSGGFLRRMSVKVKSIVLGKENEERTRPKIEVIDLSDDKGKTVIRQMSVQEICHGGGMDKSDGASFSRSRSSSMSSLENVSREAIQSLVFADSYARKTDNFTSPCLWVGTSLGSVIVIVLNLPLQGDQRGTQPVIVSPSGTLIRLKGSVLTMSFLDCMGTLIPTQFEQWQERKESKDKEKRDRNTTPTTPKPRISPSPSTEISDKQYAIICSEKQARVVSLPSQTCPYKTRITDASFVVRADVVSLRDSVCLACYIANGHITVFSLPSLKPLLDLDFLPLTDLRIARTFGFSSNGHACYLCSPTEIQKISFSADISDNLNEMLADLFLPCETPEAPKQGFLKSLFGGGTSTLDREELFGEMSGKGPRGLATRLPGTGGMQHLQTQTTSATGEVGRAHKAFIERGEKLSDLGDRSEQMTMQAESFATASHQLMLKYKDKKWYQF
ncbi:syntaxin-binding protein 5-like isoform X1 [Pecten maximus]|uniref:syntaxin-binding protein 5-like isoform X1 n=1 Tax=Pecten maximus TaxID=6579 RepID=UPI00145853D1|nr:syntaxin-binding protein 5-like isoform X1 [Pecten maximus]